MTTGSASVQLPSIGAAASQERDVAGAASGTLSAAVATATGKAVVVGFAPEVNVAAPVQAELRVRYDIDTSSLAPAPPESAERLLCYLLPMHRRNEILGDLEEDYRTNFLPKYGSRTARRMYWAHFIWSVAATVRPWLWAAILGAAGWLTTSPSRRHLLSAPACWAAARLTTRSAGQQSDYAGPTAAGESQTDDDDGRNRAHG